MSRPLHLLIVTDQFAPLIGGAAKVPEALAASVPDRISIAAPGAGVSAGYDKRFAFRVYRTGPYRPDLSRSIPGKLRGALQRTIAALWTYPRAWRDVRHAIVAAHPDVVCLNTLGATFWLVRRIRTAFPKIAVIFYAHGEEVSASGSRTDALTNRALRASDGVVSVSTFTRQRVATCGVQPEKSWVVHNGVDTQRFQPGPPSADLIARWNLAGKRVLLCLARLDERKGQDKLIAAMPSILRSVPNAVLLIVGDGGDRERLHSLATQHAVTDYVLFAGAATEPEVADYYRTADVYAMPNRTMPGGDTEGFGLVFLEAGACGKPVIGGRAGGVPDAILEGETGLLVDGESVDDIAQACIRLLSDTALAERMGHAGLAHAQRNRWADQTEKLLHICEQLAAARR